MISLSTGPVALGVRISYWCLQEQIVVPRDACITSATGIPGQHFDDESASGDGGHDMRASQLSLGLDKPVETCVHDLFAVAAELQGHYRCT